MLKRYPSLTVNLTKDTFRSKLTFRPHSTDSQTHRKMTLSIADRFSKAQKIRVLPAVGKDPESQRLERIKVHTLPVRCASPSPPPLSLSL